MNSILLGAYPKAYITNDCPKDLKILLDSFFNKLKQINPNMLIGVIGDRINMTHALSKLDGGLRCMTSEVVTHVS